MEQFLEAANLALHARQGRKPVGRAVLSSDRGLEDVKAMSNIGEVASEVAVPRLQLGNGGSGDPWGLAGYGGPVRTHARSVAGWLCGQVRVRGGHRVWHSLSQLGKLGEHSSVSFGEVVAQGGSQGTDLTG